MRKIKQIVKKVQFDLLLFVVFPRDDYRIMMSADGQSKSFSTLARASPADAHPVQPNQYCDTRMVVWCVVIVAVLLFIWAVVYNMEPAFSNPMIL